MFGVGWGIGYGPSSAFTETYVALHSWNWEARKFEWGVKSTKSLMPLD
jgi:hypothetical protein